MSRRLLAAGLAAAFIMAAGGAHTHAADLGADTLDAFDRYVRLTEARIDGELHDLVGFLWIDRLPAADRRDAYQRLERGDIVVSRLVTRDAGRTIDAPHGLIHHWIGAVLIPGATVERVVAFMQQYDRYQVVYAPNVRRSRTIARDGDRFRVFLQLYMKKVIGVVLNTENDVQYTRPAASRAHVRSHATRIAEVQDGGEVGEAEVPPGQDSGFLWRFENYCSLDERAEGTYVQCESVSLSRSIPAGLGWIVGPFVTAIPRESLEFTLGHMRLALAAGSWAAGPPFALQ